MPFRTPTYDPVIGNNPTITYIPPGAGYENIGSNEESYENPASDDIAILTAHYKMRFQLQ